MASFSSSMEGRIAALEAKLAARDARDRELRAEVAAAQQEILNTRKIVGSFRPPEIVLFDSASGSGEAGCADLPPPPPPFPPERVREQVRTQPAAAQETFGAIPSESRAEGRRPRKLKSQPKNKDRSKWCDFHDVFGHATVDCITLRNEMVRFGHLKNLMTENGNATIGRTGRKRKRQVEYPRPSINAAVVEEMELDDIQKDCFAISAEDMVFTLKKLGREVRWPRKLKSLPEARDQTKWCEFHDGFGHLTADCLALRHEIIEMMKLGHLKYLLTEKGRETLERAASKKGQGRAPIPPQVG